MPTDREREYYALGFRDGAAVQEQRLKSKPIIGIGLAERRTKPKRKLSAWNKFVKANSKKKIYQYANGKLKLKKMGIAFRKKRR